MPEYYDLTDLKVVGSDDRLSDEMVPMVVSPIFHLTDGKYLLAPYTIEGGVVYGGQVIPESRFQQLLEAESLTELPSPLQAHPDFDLWVDQEGEVQYEPMGEVSAKLKSIANDCVAEAKDMLLKGEHDGADILCRRAFRANERLVDALVIRALVADLKGEAARYRPILEKLIEDLVTPALFQVMVEDLRKQCSSELSELKQQPECSKMSQMAARKPRKLQLVG